ncbi:TPA: hypothetical protein DEO28_04630 [Candidatus Dependentiae bacterium]|nr:MAG: hypothetical protein UR14_C0002G0043 [candidate division TM6 bacterium GW2011_GWE2_31_21]KKP53840.1 MAG: hypothetical protein UR43_C0002G0043 [candidate division TM6 bacterium GW2011_GWF2_33_332]HBS47620.1 hypothetical protein [Candidatus Dependentiae bacterium]HBZ73769.1 hypothetical protein [Candidatus Dependentiae bacterium]
MNIKSLLKKIFLFSILFYLNKSNIFAGHWQIRHSNYMEGYIAKNLKLGNDFELWIYDHPSTIRFYEVEEKIILQSTRKQSFAVGFENDFYPMTNSDTGVFQPWIHELAINTYMKNKIRMFKMDFSIDLTATQRFVGHSKGNWSYGSIKPGMTLLKSKNGTIYIYDRLYYGYHNYDVDRNRTAIGAEIKLVNDKVKLDTYFMIEYNRSESSPKWIPTNVLGLNLSTNF